MKKRMLTLVMLLVLGVLLSGCKADVHDEAEDEPVWLNMNMEYRQPSALPDGGGQRVKVVLLLGQSNATGCGLNSYLEKQLAAAYRESLLGENRPVLLEEPLPDGRMAGYTPEYVQVAVEGGKSGQLVTVALAALPLRKIIISKP
jgi:hypothetical protein